jgi:hypothetical protein
MNRQELEAALAQVAARKEEARQKRIRDAVAWSLTTSAGHGWTEEQRSQFTTEMTAAMTDPKAFLAAKRSAKK